VVGFDLAGPEHGYPVSHHGPAIRYAQEQGLGITLHAGEGAGVNSIEEALDAGASRIGHGVRIIEDIDTTVEPARLGDVSARLLGSQGALEICPTSNVHTGVTASIAAHPIKTLLDAGFAVTVNTDNRLISGVSATSELAVLVEHQGWDWGQLETVTNNAIDASFQDHAFKSYLSSLVRPWYQNLASSARLPRPIEDMSC
jgi:adenosine deaminase